MKRLLAGFLVLFPLIFPSSLQAGTRDTLFHQGIVFDSENNPLQGFLSVAYRLYDVSQGGTPLWEETLSTEFREGLFSVELGEVTPFPSDLFSNDSLFLGIQIDGDTEMVPRLELHAVPFAKEAELAVTALSLKENVITSAQIVPGAIDASDLAVGSVGGEALAATGVVPGTYSLATITVDQDGRILSASQGSAGNGNVDASKIAGTLGDSQISDSLTIGPASTVADAALSSNVTKLGGTIESGEITNVDVSKIVGTLEDSQISDTLTIGTAGTVADAALSSNVTKLGGTIESGEISNVDASKIAGTLGDSQISDNLTIGPAGSVAEAALPTLSWGKVSKVGAVPADVGAAAAAHSHLAAEIVGELTDAQISDILTANRFVGTGSTTTAVDLQSAEVAGLLGVDKGGTGADLSTTGGAGQFVRQSSTGAPLSVEPLTDADIPNSITVDLATTATSLAANGSNCAPGEFSQGVDASGNAEGCAPAGGGGTPLLNIQFFDSNDPAPSGSNGSNTTNDCTNFNNTGTTAGRLGAVRLVTLDGFSTIRIIGRAAIATGQGQPTIRIQDMTAGAPGTTLVSISTGWTTTCATQSATAPLAATGLRKLECQEFSGVATEDPKYSHCAIELIP